MRIELTFRRAVLLAAAALGLGLAVAWSGLFNVAASTGHWAVTDWFLHYVMRQSVKTHAMGIEPPPLDRPRLVHRGAGHYATGCAPCHGAPGVAQSPVALEMTPKPPYLPRRVSYWQPAELFWIVQHGVKFTGMPAWAARGREDEVWAVVAFLARLPGMDAGEYRRLAAGAPSSAGEPDPPAGFDALADPFDATLAECVRCHGRDGGGRGGAFPRLHGQSEEYLFATLDAYHRGGRRSGIMQPAARALDEAGMRRLAAHFAAADPPPAGGSPAAAASTLGETIARQGVPKDGIPACGACHDPRATERYPLYPSLDTQTADYLALQLRLFREGARGGTAYAPIMETIARRMSDAQIEAVAAYFSAPPPRQ